jgi:hypothetical protein
MIDADRVWNADGLLSHDADHGRARLDHIEFVPRRTAYVDDAPTAVRTAIGDAYNDCLAVAHVCNQHLGAKRQRAVSGREPGWAGYFPARGSSSAIECSHTAFGMDRTGGCRRQNDSQS